jgi:hypothetical protein
MAHIVITYILWIVGYYFVLFNRKKIKGEPAFDFFGDVCSFLIWAWALEYMKPKDFNL